MGSGVLVDPMSSVRAYLEAKQSSGTRKGHTTDWAGFLA